MDNDKISNEDRMDSILEKFAIQYYEEKKKKFYCEGKGFELFKDKCICDILGGYVSFGDIIIDGIDSPIKNAMPYLHVGKVRDLCYRVGLRPTFNENKHACMRNLVYHFIGKERVNDLLCHFFSMEHFKENLKSVHNINLETVRNIIVDKTISEINKLLYLNGYEMIVSNKKFTVVPHDNPFNVELPSMKNLDLLDLKIAHLYDVLYNCSISLKKSTNLQIYYATGSLACIIRAICQLSSVWHNKKVGDYYTFLYKVFTDTSEKIKNKTKEKACPYCFTIFEKHFRGQTNCPNCQKKMISYKFGKPNHLITESDFEHIKILINRESKSFEDDFIKNFWNGKEKYQKISVELKNIGFLQKCALVENNNIKKLHHVCFGCKELNTECTHRICKSDK